MCRSIKLSDFNGDFQKFMEACYAAYLAFWQSSPTFCGKDILRNTVLVRGKETDFWSVVDGHDADKDVDVDRYGKTPILGRVVNKEHLRAATDVVYFRRLHQRKVRIEVFSKKHRFLVVLQQIGSHEKVQFITAHPLSKGQLQKKLERVKEYKRGGDEVL
jgi:hypothetical protein